MTSPVDELLARALLHSDPYTPQETETAEQRLIARMSAALDEPAPTAPGESPPDEAEAARDLRTLSETVVARTAMDSLGAFITKALPEPPGARVLGCILQLKDSEESARFWWQYAAGAGDPAASYCLYLHHLSLGERGEARWWHTQTRHVQTAPQPPSGTRAEEQPDSQTGQPPPPPTADLPDVVSTLLH
ncbi:hypothetical protein ACFYYH_14835 [Streptomyces sp. NPDC002018]|uniref:hypothetical protein n=1 Tax=Streptomyces sp. NPDC002018 TaxID=3364629 RepID=UPI0036BEBB25